MADELAIAMRDAGAELAETFSSRGYSGPRTRYGTVTANNGTTLDVALAGGTVPGVPMTTACVGARAGDRVLLTVDGPLVTATGILATADNGPYVKGSIYITAADVDPNGLFPGTTWQRVEGRFLLGASSSHALGSTGGEESHALSWNEMPAHTHGWGHWLAYDKGHWCTDLASVTTPCAANGASPPFADGPGSTDSAGSGWAHNNMPPFLAVNIWRRVA